MGESWIVSNLNAALSTWNDKLAEIWSLLTESPQTFKGGQVWGVMTGIHGALQAIGYGLLVLFFAVGVMKTCGSFVEVKKPEHALKLFIRFALAKGAVTYGLELMLAVFSVVQGMVSTIITQSGSSGMSSVSLPQELIDAINNVGFWDSIPLWAVTLIGGLLITVLSFTMILTVYGRMFSLWMYAAIAPIPLSTFAGEPTSSVGKNFIRSYAGVCLQGVVIALSCIIFSAISSSPPAVDTGASVVTAVWTYVGELAFNLLVLVGAIKGCDRIVIVDEPTLRRGLNGCCVPGKKRLYVTATGEYKACERIGSSPSIGNVDEGVDRELIVKKYVEEFAAQSKDICDKCWAYNLCRVCYAGVCNENGLDMGLKNEACRASRSVALNNLALYHELMEENPEALNCLKDAVIE